MFGLWRKVIPARLFGRSSQLRVWLGTKALFVDNHPLAQTVKPLSLVMVIVIRHGKRIETNKSSFISY